MLPQLVFVSGNSFPLPISCGLSLNPPLPAYNGNVEVFELNFSIRGGIGAGALAVLLAAIAAGRPYVVGTGIEIGARFIFNSKLGADNDAWREVRGVGFMFVGEVVVEDGEPCECV